MQKSHDCHQPILLHGPDGFAVSISVHAYLPRLFPTVSQSQPSALSRQPRIFLHLTSLLFAIIFAYDI